ncbi:hypothetical protein C4J81_12595 [Deltaproteobacteria bacterium Smac51]|nr:hypothetical protein C4J81_12595 [Deltaproteobacteria bacterium Smac51]
MERFEDSQTIVTTLPAPEADYYPDWGAERRRRPQEPPEPLMEGGSRTMVLYTTLMLILVSFFVILVSRANFDETKYATALGSIQNSFGVLTGGRVAIGGDDGLPDLTMGFDDEGHLVLPEMEMAQIRAVLAPAIMDREARIIHTKGQRIISLSAGLVFKPDSWELSEEMAETLLVFSRIMADNAIAVTVEGHTDNRPPQTRDIGDNWDISGGRAIAVMDFLAASGGLERDRLNAFAYAGGKPLYSNMTPAGRAKNNRVDLVLDFSSISADELKDLAEKATTYNFRGFDFLLRENGEGL